MFWIWLHFTLLISCLLEGLAGLWHLALPFFLSTVFYYSCLVSWPKGILFYCVCAALLDGWFARVLPCNVIGVVAVLFFAGFWRQYGDLKSAFSLCVPGAFLGVVSGSLLLVNRCLQGAGIQGSLLLSGLCYFIASTILLPCIWCLLEICARFMALRRQEVFSPAMRQEELSAREEIADE